MNSIFDTVADRRNTNSEKWNKIAISSIAANSEAEPFWVADMDFLPEPHIKAKAEELAAELYAALERERELKRSVSGLAARIYKYEKEKAAKKETPKLKAVKLLFKKK